MISIELEELREHALQKPGVSEDFPFDEDVLALRVMGKIFALTNLRDYPSSVNLKCDPARALELRERYAAISPGYHMNKKHWNTIALDGTIPYHVVLALVDHSYELVTRGLTLAQRQALHTLAASAAAARPPQEEE